MSKETRYVAALTFVLEDSKQNTLGAYSGLASQFGLDLGGGGSNGIFSDDNIMEFLKSRLIIEKALLSPFTKDNRTLSLVDYYLEINGTRKAWGDNSAVKNLRYPVNSRRNTFTIQQDSVLNLVYEEIKNKRLNITKSDKKSSFIIVECTTEDEIFSKVFTERLVKEAADFYVRTKTMRSKLAVDKLQLKADSLETLLNRKTYSVAASQDMNLNPARSMAGVSTELASRDKLVLQTMYSEVIKNLELSRMSMAQETPVIQVVDTPILPLKKERFGKFRGLIIGGFIAGFLAVLWFLLRKIYTEIMN
ncbi:hypothetical protein [Chitinophaga sp. YIM B06452]|uniref:hypothetical protein n=1 Tax=Chitinophaga sp. YIM B06452 TaxID=3082158 RepID=UPI0031FE7BED